MRNICVFTATRAEFGLLRRLLIALRASPNVSLKLLASGTHLADSTGLTKWEIKKAGFTIDESVEVNVDGNSKSAVCTAMGLGMMRYGKALKRLHADCVLVVGDRFEALALAAAATVFTVPIVHLHGGELTLGAIDDAFRHAITKMSHLHFTSTDAYRRRVIQLGEDPARVFNVGALGVDNVRTLPMQARDKVEKLLGIEPGAEYMMATFHPETLSNLSPEQQLKPLLAALDRFPGYVKIFTGANADAGGSAINKILAEIESKSPDEYRFVMSLGATNYLSAVRHAAVVVGNSSSAIIEVPSMGIPSVDIGSRQEGRLRSKSVISCKLETKAITVAIKRALTPAFRRQARQVKNPYEKKGTVKLITRELKKWLASRSRNKGFYDMPR